MGKLDLSVANPPVRFCALLAKSADETPEEFQQLWSGNSTLSEPGEDKIMKHCEFHHDENFGFRFTELGYPLELKDFEGASSIYCTDIETVKEVVSRWIVTDPGLRGTNSPDEIYLLNCNTPVIVGYDVVVIDNTHKVAAGKRLVKFVGLLTRNKDTKSDEFHEQWAQTQTELFCSNPVVREKVIKYSQFHSSPQWTEQVEKMGFNISGFDGIMEIYTEKIDDLIEIFRSEVHFTNGLPETYRLFLDMESVGVLLGYEDVKLDKSLPDSGS